MTTAADARDRRLLVLAPTAKDGAIMKSIVAPTGIAVEMVSSCAALVVRNGERRSRGARR